jgi:hypothetical protein
METPIRPTNNKRFTRAVRVVVSLVITVFVIALYILVLSRGHVPTHLPILTH